MKFSFGQDHDPLPSTFLTTSFTFINPSTYWSDDTLAPLGFTGFENIKNVGIAAQNPGGAFVPTAAGFYDFRLSVFDVNGSLLDRVTMKTELTLTPPVITHNVPEPAALALVLTGLMGIGALRRRKTSK